jgi:hypothetical protein
MMKAASLAAVAEQVTPIAPSPVSRPRKKTFAETRWQRVLRRSRRKVWPKPPNERPSNERPIERGDAETRPLSIAEWEEPGAREAVELLEQRAAERAVKQRATARMARTIQEAGRLYAAADHIDG